MDGANGAGSASGSDYINHTNGAYDVAADYNAQTNAAYAAAQAASAEYPAAMYGTAQPGTDYSASMMYYADPTMSHQLMGYPTLGGYYDPNTIMANYGMMGMMPTAYATASIPTQPSAGTKRKNSGAATAAASSAAKKPTGPAKKRKKTDDGHALGTGEAGHHDGTDSMDMHTGHASLVGGHVVPDTMTMAKQNMSGQRRKARYNGLSCKPSGKWRVRISAGNTSAEDVYVGTFAIEEEAALAYDLAAIRIRGPEWARKRLNFPRHPEVAKALMDAEARQKLAMDASHLMDHHHHHAVSVASNAAAAAQYAAVAGGGSHHLAHSYYQHQIPLLQSMMAAQGQYFSPHQVMALAQQQQQQQQHVAAAVAAQSAAAAAAAQSTAASSQARLVQLVAGTSHASTTMAALVGNALGNNLGSSLGGGLGNSLAAAAAAVAAAGAGGDEENEVDENELPTSHSSVLVVGGAQQQQEQQEQESQQEDNNETEHTTIGATGELDTNAEAGVAGTNNSDHISY